MIIMLEQDKRGGFSKRPYIEVIGPMTRIIWGWWSVAVFENCGINDISRVFRAHERDLLVGQGRLENNRPAS